MNQNVSYPSREMVSKFVHRLPHAGWAYSCLRSLQNAFGDDLERLAEGLTGKDGSVVSGLSDETWGIALELCHSHCGVVNATKELNLRWPVSAF
jgi:hypothetical protein